MNVSIILTCHNKEHLIGDVVRRLVDNTASSCQLVLVYDGCTDASERVVNETLNNYGHGSIAHVIAVHTANVFETKANNVGMQHADGDVFLLLQDDMLVNEHGWEQRLVYPLQAYTDVLSVTAKGAHNITVRRRPILFRDAALDCTHVASRKQGLDRNVFAVRDTANRGPLALHAEKVRMLNFLDEQFAPYTWDDHDLNLRAYTQYRWLAGCYWIDFISEPEWGTTRTKNRELFARTYRRNVSLLYRRHHKLITSDKHDEERPLSFERSAARR